MTPTPQAIGAMLRKAREAKGLKPWQVAKRCALPTNLVHAAEDGHEGDGLRNDIATALGLELVVTMAIVDPVTGVTVAEARE